jgi:hypothetical protein
MSWRRLVTPALLIYLAMDLSDPTVPGVFSLKAGGLFLDGALDGRAQPVSPRSVMPASPAVADRRVEPTRSEPDAPPLAPVDPPRVHRSAPRLLSSPSTDAGSEDH